MSNVAIQFSRVALSRRRLLLAGAGTFVSACGGGGGGGGSDGAAGGEGRFTAVASMRTGRDRPSAVRLSSGRVLVAGGRSSGALTSSAEIFDPASGQWTAAAAMRTARWAGGNDGFLINLPNGQVLALGGAAELYDPGADTWTPVANTPAAVGSGGSKTLLKDGRVLLIPGGGTAAYLYDPVGAAWSGVPGFDGRTEHAAARLGDGRVLVSGGHGNGSAYLPTALLFDPANGSWRATGTLRVGRYQHFSFALADGRVVVSHGVVSAPTVTDSTEIYDAASGTWRAGGDIHKFSPSTSGATGTLMKDGRFLVAGGATTGSSSPILDQVPQGLLDETNAEWFDSTAAVWRRATRAPGGLVVPRYGHAAVALDDGSVLLAGGLSGTTSAEIFRG